MLAFEQPRSLSRTALPVPAYSAPAREPLADVYQSSSYNNEFRPKQASAEHYGSLLHHSRSFRAVDPAPTAQPVPVQAGAEPEDALQAELNRHRGMGPGAARPRSGNPVAQYGGRVDYAIHSTGAPNRLFPPASASPDHDAELRAHADLTHPTRSEFAELKRGADVPHPATLSQPAVPASWVDPPPGAASGPAYPRAADNSPEARKQWLDGVGDMFRRMCLQDGEQSGYLSASAIESIALDCNERSRLGFSPAQLRAVTVRLVDRRGRVSIEGFVQALLT